MKDNGLRMQKYGKSALSAFFALISIAYIFPVFMVVVNSFKQNTFVKTETFAMPNAETFAGWEAPAEGAMLPVKTSVTALVKQEALQDPMPLTDAEETAEVICYRLGHRFCYNNVRRTVVAGDGPRVMTVDELKEQSPIEFAEMFLSDCGVVFDDEMRDMFKQAMDLVNESKRNS